MKTYFVSTIAIGVLAAACSGASPSGPDDAGTGNDAPTGSDVTAPTSDAGQDTAAVDAGADGSCPPDEKSCNASCVSTSDPSHGCSAAACSACAVAHATPACTGGACAIGTCDPNYGDCDMNAANGCETQLASDHDHCGACPTACTAAQVCNQGMCVTQCTGGLENCAGSCVDINSDPNHCGNCTFQCPMPTNGVATCTAKMCGVACSAGYHACGNVCADDTSVNSCGASCTPCFVPDHGVATCISGACGIACLPGYQACGNTCSNTGCNPDAGADGGDAGSDGSTVNLPGKQLQQGNDLTIWAVTSDGYVIYYDHTKATLDAVPIAGGPPQLVSSSPGTSFSVVTSNKVAFVWTNLDANKVGQLVVWTAANGAHNVSAASSSGFGLAAADASSFYIAYLTNSNGATQTSDLYGAVSDGTFATLLQPRIVNPFVVTTGSYVIANGSVAPADGGPALSQVSSFALGSWARTDLATSSAAAILWSYTGTEALVTDDQGLEVFPLGGGAPTTIDPNGTYYGAALTPDGSTVVYATNTPPDGGLTNTFDRSRVMGPSPVVLNSGSNLTVYTPSPDGLTMLGFSQTSLVMTPTTGPSPLTTIAPSTNLAFPFYTNDSSRVVYLTNYNIGNSGDGTLNVLPVAGGSPAVLGQNVYTWGATGPTKVVFNDNYVTPFADLKVVDTATTAGPTLIVSQAHATWSLTPAGDQVIYSWSAQVGPAAGIYVAPIP